MREIPKVALYVRALDLEKIGDNLKEFYHNFERLDHFIKFNKAYLETHRDMVLVEDNVLVNIKEYLEEKGISVSGGITVTVDEMDDFKTYCYSNPDHRERIQSFVEKTAGIFDEILFDDFFFTNCKCTRCISEKGNRSWSEFRLEQMLEASKTLVLNVAKKVNPQVSIGIKYPNWYEHFPESGFNLKDQPPIYDFIYTGTETRDPHLNNQHLQPYQSYGIVRYYENIKPSGNGGGWVDPFGSKTVERYTQQILLTLLAKAKEITLFAYHALIDRLDEDSDENMIKIAGESIDTIKSVLPNLGRPIGIKAYKPYHSKGEDFLHQYMGTIGLPMEMVPDFPGNERLVFLNQSAAEDDLLIDKMKQHLINGNHLIITSGLISILEKRNLSDIMEIHLTQDKIHIDELMIGWEPVGYKTLHPITLSKMQLMTNDVWDEISGISNWFGTSFLSVSKYGEGKIYIINIPDNYSDLYALPEPILNKLRFLVCSDYFPIYIKEASAKVGLIIYDNNTFSIASFNNCTTQVTVMINEGCEKIEDLISHQSITGQAEKRGTCIRISMGPEEVKVFKIIKCFDIH
jgi:hypothetical protein